MEIIARNVNDLFSEGLWKLKICGVEDTSRNGPVVRIPEPVLVTLNRPLERVLFNGERDCNPIFHLLESVHILAGRRDVAFLKQFNQNIGQFSDDGEVFNAAYGYRMRRHFGRDQLVEVIKALKADPASRQAVIQLWDSEDLTKSTLDKCCNTQLVFSVNCGKVDLLVFNRSNDFIWGHAGANAVHFSFLLEFVASSLSREVGKMRTVSNNLHFYKKLYPRFNLLLENPPDPSAYDAYAQGVKPYPIMNHPDPEIFLADCEYFCTDPFNLSAKYYNSFFHDVAQPMAMASKVRKEKTGDGMYWASRIATKDWRIAVEDWIERRELAKRK